MANEAVIANFHLGADKGMRLNSGSVSNSNTALYFHKRADKTIVPEGATVKVGGQNNFKILAVGDTPQASNGML